jgi:hypothetical protein
MEASLLNGLLMMMMMMMNEDECGVIGGMLDRGRSNRKKTYPNAVFSPSQPGLQPGLPRWKSSG